MIEIGVDRQMSALTRFMEPAADEERVWDQPLDARQIFQKLQERPGVEGIEKGPNRRRQVIRIETRLEALLIAVESSAVRVGLGGKFVEAEIKN